MSDDIYNNVQSLKVVLSQHFLNFSADEVIHEASLENTDCTQYNSLSTMSSDHLADNVEAPTFGMSFLPCYERIGRKDAGTAIGPKRGGKCIC